MLPKEPIKLRVDRRTSRGRSRDPRLVETAFQPTRLHPGDHVAKQVGAWSLCAQFGDATGQCVHPLGVEPDARRPAAGRFCEHACTDPGVDGRQTHAEPGRGGPCAVSRWGRFWRTPRDGRDELAQHRDLTVAAPAKGALDVFERPSRVFDLDASPHAHIFTLTGQIVKIPGAVDEEHRRVTAQTTEARDGMGANGGGPRLSPSPT